ncbi:hypothetical protein RFI_11118, partial [Reticulomyxa filosa]
DPHGMPSGGDWALQRQAAITIEYASGIWIVANLFTRLDGNAIIMNRFNRRHLIFDNEIVWNGDTAIASWGDTNGITFPISESEETSMGWDGTDGNQPRQVEIVANYVHELGIWEKQSSFYFQGKSCLNVVAYNIFYNGPRAGINFNDGFGGGTQITRNLLFNTCRESGDHGFCFIFFFLNYLFIYLFIISQFVHTHTFFFFFVRVGPFNSWDRQVYVTDVKYGYPSVIKQWDYISYNFILANYNSIGAIDNDDGSCFYQTHHNFFVYG